MIDVKDTRGNRRTYAEIKALPGMGRRAMRHAWFDFARDLKRTANAEILRRPKGGRTYYIRIRGGRRRRHVASAPGETHANLHGLLRRSLSWKVHGTHEMEFGYGVATTGKNEAPYYASYVEEGTSRMDERPSLGNAVAAAGDRVGTYFLFHFEEERKRGAAA